MYALSTMTGFAPSSGDVHPDRDALHRFMRADLPAAEAREVLRHLLGDCEVCRRTTGDLWQVGGGPDTAQESGPAPPAEAHEYGAAFESVSRVVEGQAAAVDRERAEAPALLQELERRPPARQRLLVQNRRRFHTWGLVEHLLEESYRARFDDPERSRHLAELGLAAAESLDPDRYAAAPREDLQARAWAFLGNARRLLADLQGAWEALDRARSHLDRGTGNPLERARLLRIEAALASDRGDFVRAAQLLERVIARYDRARERHLAGRTRINQGLYRGYAGDFSGAIRRIREGLRDIDGEREPRLVLLAHHNLILFLAESGRLGEARALLARSRPLYQEAGDPITLARLAWLEGKIALALAQWQEAEAHLEAARRTLAEESKGLEAAMASLDLAACFLEQGKTRETRRLAEEMIAVFRACDLEREATAALIVFLDAARLETATLGMIHEVARRLGRLRRGA